MSGTLLIAVISGGVMGLLGNMLGTWALRRRRALAAQLAPARVPSEGHSSGGTGHDHMTAAQIAASRSPRVPSTSEGEGT